jgi:uncharacterized protein DUF87
MAKPQNPHSPAGGVIQELKALASVDLFKEGRNSETFIGRPFHFDYTSVSVLVNDKWKRSVGGVPAGSFLLAAYDGEEDVAEAVLLRVTGPTGLPTDSEVVASMVEYYKEGVDTSRSAPQPQAPSLDSYTRYEFMFSGLECRVLGTFFRGASHQTMFGADVENFYSAHNYAVYKPKGRVLEYIVNFREGEGVPGGVGQFRLGEVRYSASRRFEHSPGVPVYVSAFDFIGKRTALFGMTRTGKSNTVKKLVESTVRISQTGTDSEGQPLAPVGQIIFDVNGEYANANQQDEGTAIFELFSDITTRYSILEKSGFQVMRLNFFRELVSGQDMLRSFLGEQDAGYIRSFLSIDLTEPPQADRSAHTRWSRVAGAYEACLGAAGFAPGQHRIRFEGHGTLNALAGGIDPTHGLTVEQAIQWFTAVWQNYASHAFFTTYQLQHGHEWADEDLKAALIFLTRQRTPGRNADVLGFRLLMPIREYHTSVGTSYEADILGLLRQGRLVIVDLSQGDPIIQRTYSDRLCRVIFKDAMQQFINNRCSNVIQFYFEEAHNLFPKRDDADLTQIYNRLAKEGAKLRIGLVYATQEVSSISTNVLKNTQNWFISHLNNRDELKEISKYYDFEDFLDSLRTAADRGFIRMKTYSNAFIVPVQIDRFLANRKPS